MTITLNGDGTATVAPERAEVGTLVKADGEKRLATFVAYPANKPDAAVAADGHIDFASKDVVEKAAHDWLAKGGRLGLWHKQPTDDFEVVESGIHHGPDWVVKAADGTEAQIMDGDWIVTVRAKTAKAWQMVKDGLIGGASPQGACVRRTPAPSVLAQLRS